MLITFREAYCDMKIKEKGLTGKAAAIRRQSLAGPGRKGFNAFEESKKPSEKDKGKEKAKPEVWLEFMGSKIRVYDEDGGTIKDEELPFVRGATMKFEGCGDNVSFDEIKVRVGLPCFSLCSLKPRSRVR